MVLLGCLFCVLRNTYFVQDSVWLSRALEHGSVVCLSSKGEFGFRQAKENAMLEPSLFKWREVSGRAVEDPVLLGVVDEHPVWAVRVDELPQERGCFALLFPFCFC
jgi:hypothetical protein